MLVLVTVGSTRFDSLVQAIFSTPVLASLRAKGYDTVVVQCGNSTLNSETGAQDASDDSLYLHKNGLDIEVWKFKPSLQADYKRADLVISHAGSGTLLDVLRLQKPLIAVPNPTLLDNHQEDLASALSGLRHLESSSVAGLPETIMKLDVSSLIPFPRFDGSRFRELLDEEMGYS